MNRILNIAALAGSFAISLGVFSPQASLADTYEKRTFTYSSSMSPSVVHTLRSTSPSVVERVIERPVTIQKVLERPVMTEKCLSSPVTIERVIEKPVVVEKVVEKPVFVEKVIEKPVFVERVFASPMVIKSTSKSLLMNRQFLAPAAPVIINIDD
ncbi:MAG: hypothetical protein K2Z81_27505 [Cyanobacteria bacterium]|nr:hypothetical protein [Cyanobacteriota bacterium]